MLFVFCFAGFLETGEQNIRFSQMSSLTYSNPQTVKAHILSARQMTNIYIIKRRKCVSYQEKGWDFKPQDTHHRQDFFLCNFCIWGLKNPNRKYKMIAAWLCFQNSSSRSRVLGGGQVWLISKIIPMNKFLWKIAQNHSNKTK